MNYGNPSLQLIAGGNIRPFRIVALSTAADSTVLESTSNTSKNIGVSSEGTRRAPGTGDDDGNAAISGENIEVLTVGSGIARVQLSGTTTRGDALTSDSGALALTTTTDGDFIIGFALQSGAANDVIRFLCMPGYRTQ